MLDTTGSSGSSAGLFVAGMVCKRENYMVLKFISILYISLASHSIIPFSILFKNVQVRSSSSWI